MSVLNTALSLVLACVFFTHGLRAEEQETEAAAESRQYQAEEKADLERNGDPELAFSHYQGKLLLYTQAQSDASGDPSILGTFESGGITYFVKTVHEATRKPLEKLSGKACTLNAKVRNNGKYLIVKNIVQAGAGMTGAQRRGGL